LVDVTVILDVASGEVTWIIETIDPLTGDLPNDAYAGFLPPNDETGGGEGFVSYTIRPRTDAPSGAAIDAQATIVFDSNEPIDTPAITNRLDATPPVSQVTAATPAGRGSDIAVVWEGTDPDSEGSGLAGFSVYVSDRDAPATPWLVNTALTSAQFAGEPGHTYRFYSIARDHAGNLESPPVEPDASAAVPGLPPVAEPDDYACDEDTVLQVTAAAGVLANDHDPEGAPLQASLQTPPAHGTVALAPDGSFEYTPDPDFDGEDVFSYEAGDGQDGAAAATVTVVVRPQPDPPVAVADHFEVDEDSRENALDLLANDHDPDGGVLQVVALGQPAHGSVAVVEGVVLYTPAPDYVGADAFTYAASGASGLLSATVTVTLTVRDTNDPPVLARIGDHSIVGRSTLTFTATATDPDLPAQTLSYSLDDAALVAGMRIDPAAGVFSWTPGEEQVGAEYRVTLTVNDDGTLPASLSNAETFAVRVFRGSVVRLWASGPSGPLAVLELGEVETATTGFDEAWDQHASIPGEDEAGAYIETETGAKRESLALSRDSRPRAETTRWRLVVLGDAAGTPLTLAWDVAAVEAEREIYLQELSDEQPVGFPVDLRQSASLEEVSTATFEVCLGVGETITLPVANGWSLLGSPIMSTRSAGEVFTANPGGPGLPTTRWYWRDGGYQLHGDDAPLSPELGYWVHGPASGWTQAIVGVRADGVVRLRPGWNLVSPVADCIMPEAAGLGSRAWGWDSGLRCYLAVGPGSPLTAGRGYWFYVTAEQPVLVPLH
jgi:hypothetical protein